MTTLGRVVLSAFDAMASGAVRAMRRGGVAAAVLALAGGMAVSGPAQAANGVFNGGASLTTNGQCTAASPSSFGVSFTANFQSADTGSLDTYSLLLLDGTNTIIGSSNQGISASASTSTTLISAPTTQTPTDGSAYTLVAYNQNTGSPIYSVGDLYESDDLQMASLGFDASALDSECPGPNSARPTPTITTAANPTNAAFVATITFDASVTGFDVSDLVVGNGAASGFTGSGVSYSATITPVVDGDVTLNIPAAAAATGAGTESNAAPTLTVVYDATAPQPEFIDAEADTTIEGPITAFLQFDEIVTGVSSSQIVVTNGAISDFTQVSNQLYSFTLTPDPGQTGGSVVLTYAAGQVSDLAGNLNGAVAKGYTANTDAPSVVISTSETEPVGGTFIVDVVFNEVVTGFDVADFPLLGGYTVDSVSGSGTTYTATVTPTATGTLSLVVAAGAAIDGDTNGNTVSNFLQVAADVTVPTVAITTAESSPVGASFIATVTFSKKVVDFVVGDLVLTNATATDFTGSDDVYFVTILPVATGTVKIDIPAAAAQDTGGRDNTAAATLTLQADVVAPTLTMTSAAVGPVSAPFSLLLDFSETSVGFTLSDLTVVNGVASNLQRSGDDLVATITPTAVGTLTVDVADGAFQDVAGNDNTPVTQFSIESTANGAPSVVIASTSAGLVSGNPFPVTVTFSEAVTGFLFDEIVIVNGTRSSESISGNVYSFTVTPIADGVVSVDVPAGVAQDADLNDNTAATQFSVTADATAPTVAITSSAVAPVTGAFTVTLTFSEDMGSVGPVSLTVGNGSVTSVTGSGTVYTATILPTVDGTVTVDVLAGAATDLAGNGNTAATQFSIAAVLGSPTLAITGPAGPLADAFTATFTFSESVTGFTVDDIIVGNGAASSFAGTGAVYTATIIPDAAGLVTIDVAAAAAQNGGSINSAAAPQYSVTAASLGPIATITSATTSIAGAGFIQIAVAFDEDVAGLAATDFVITGGGTPVAFGGSGSSYAFFINATGGVDLVVSLPASSATAVAGGAPNRLGADLVIPVAVVPSIPTVVIASGAADPVTASTFDLTVTFSEDVTGFTITDLTVDGGQASAFSGSGAVYTATITPTRDGTLTIDIADSVATSSTGGGNTSATQFSITVNQQLPQPTITSALSGTVSGAFDIAITFNEPVTGFDSSDLTVVNGAASNFAGSGSAYSATITPAADGVVTVDIAAAAAVDISAGDSLVAAQFSVTNDETGATPTLSSTSDDPFAGSFVLNVAFDEAVTGFTASDLTVSNGTASGAAGSGAAYTVTITPTASGPVTVDMAAGKVGDAAGNPNLVAAQFSITADITAPSGYAVSIDQDPIFSGNVTALSISFTGFEVGATLDYTISSDGGGTAITDSVLVPVAAGTISGLDGSGLGDGTVTLTASLTDSLGNVGADETDTATKDTADPTVVLSTASADPVSGAFTLDVVFSESVTGFAVGDLTVANGAASAFAGSGTTYSATITPAADGAVTVDVAAAAAQDSAGNDNTAATQFSITNDGTAPTVALSTVSGDPVSGAFTLDVVFSESVTGFAVGDLTVANGAASAFAGSGTTYSATITPAADGAVTVDVAAAAAQDSAGNDNTAATQFSITNDGTAPTVALSTVSGDPVSGAFTLDVVFSESVTGFAVGDLTVANGAASAFAGSGTTYSATITPAADGAVTVDVAAAAAQDSAGNDNTAATQFSITNDGTAPTVALSTVSGDPVSGAFTLDVVFSESVTGFAVGDLTVANGAASAFAGSGATYSATITPAADGAVTVDVAAAAAQDSAGNDNTAATQFSITNDGTAPTVALSTVSGDPVSGAFTLDVVFSESVTGFAVGDLTVANGAASAFAGSGTTYSATITPAADGAVTVDVAAAAAQDSAGNDNTAATQFSITNDGTAPSLSISGPAGTQTGAFTANFTFSESVTGFAVGDIVVGNGTASALAGSGAAYTATITPAADGPVTIDVAAAVVSDSAGNGNTAAAQLSVGADISAPTVLSVAVSDNDLTVSDIGTIFTVAATFSEALDSTLAPSFAFVGADLSATLSLQSSVWSSGDTVYTASYDLLDSGLMADDIDVTVSGGADLAGNLLADSTTSDLFSVELRRGGITITQTIDGAVDGEFDFTGDLGTFAIQTTGQTGSRAFTDLIAGTYTITPAAEDGFTFDGASCTGGTTSVDGTTGAVTIVLAPADSVSCTFATTADPAIDETEIPTVELALDSDVDDPTGTSTSFSLSNTGGSAFSFTAATDVTWLDIDPTSGNIPAEGSLEFTITFNAAVLDLDPGTYTANITITETASLGQKPLGASANTLNVVTIPVTITLQPREGTLTIIATTAPSQAGDGVFTYTSTLAQLNGLSLSTVGGTASSGALTVLRGSYSLTQATHEEWALSAMSCTGDTDGGSTFDLDTGTMVIDLDPEEAMVCTFANRRDEDFIRQVTQSAIRSFMAARADQILTNSPEIAGRMRGSRMSATPNRFAADYSQGRLSADLSTSLSAIRQAAESGEPQMPGATQFNLDGRTGLSSLDVWVQANYTSIDDNRAGLDASSTFGLYYLGVDMMASENLLVGALLQWDHAETVTGTYRSEVNGDGWLAGPYMVARLSENVYFDARGAWGQSENDVNPIGLYVDSFDTSRWLLEANVTGEINSGNWRVSPQIGIAYFNEEQTAYTDTLGFLIPSQEITLGRINAGPEIAYRFAGTEGGYIEPFIRLTALWDYDDADVYNAAGNLQGIGGLRADARFGVTAELPNGGLISGEIGIIGLGLGDFEANNAMLRIRLPLKME